MVRSNSTSNVDRYQRELSQPQREIVHSSREATQSLRSR
jgi:hypothetical protein